MFYKHRKKIIIIASILLIGFVCVMQTKNSRFDVGRNNLYNAAPANTLENKQKAIQRTANAYYLRGRNMQYESIKRDYLKAPEEATVDNIGFSTCHTFAYQIYKQAFNIDIPKGVSETYEYCKIKQGTEYVPVYYVPENFQNTSADYSKESSNYKALLDSFKGVSNNEIPETYINFIKKLKIGDVISQSRRTTGHTASHTMVVYNFEYDENNNVKDCILMESIYGTGIGGLADKDGDKLELNGTILTKKLSERLRFYSSQTDSYKSLCLVVMRPLGNTGESYCNISMDDLKAHNQNNNYNCAQEMKKITYTNSCIDRLNYPGLEIIKLGDKHNNSIVCLGDEITYTITIKNTTRSMNYTNLELKEYADPNLVDCDMSNQVINNGKIELTWSNISVDAGEEVKISYTVRVKNELNNLNKIISAEGAVNSIKTSTVVNKIGMTLSEEEQTKLKTFSKTFSYNAYSGKSDIDIIQSIYEDLFNVDIKLKKSNGSELSANDIISTNSTTKEIVVNQEYKKMILNDLYGTWESSCKVKADDRYYVWGTAEQEVSDQRAKTIVRGNLHIGDIILVSEGNNNFAYIYLGDKIIGGNNEIILESESGLSNPEYYYDVKENITMFLADLVSKDAFVIISPAIYTDITKTQLEVYYSVQEITFHEVIVTIASLNERILGVDGWQLSDEQKSLSKIFSQNTNQSVTIKDIGGNETTINIIINNISEDLRGDLNDNGTLDMGDIIKIYRHIAAQNNSEVYAKHPDWKLDTIKIRQGDLNRNTILDLGDAIKIQRYIAARNNPEVAQKHPNWLDI